MNKELILNQVLLRRESLDLGDIFVGSLDNTQSNLKDLFSRYEKEAKKNNYSVVFETVYNYEGTDVYANIYRFETIRERDKRVAEEQAREERARKAKETKKAKALAKALTTEQEERELLAKLQAKYGA